MLDLLARLWHDAYPTVKEYAPAMLLSVTVWTILKSVYNIYFHPLARFPGPKLAAASIWWETYVDVVKGELSLTLIDLHAKYGDIVRISPNELHFAKPSVYHEIYNPKVRWDKHEYLYQMFAIEESTFSIVEYEKAKKRRDVTVSLFSRKSIINMQYLVQECLDAVCANIDEHIKAGKPVRFYRAFRCFALDTISSICFARSTNATSAPDFDAPLERAMFFAVGAAIAFKHFTSLKFLVGHMPGFLTRILQPQLVGIVDLREMLKQQVKQVLRDPQCLADSPHPTIYHEFLLKDGEKNIPSELSLRDEALLYVNAGTDTVSDALSVGLLNVVHNKEIYQTLQQELKKAWPDLDSVPRYETLETLPYLKAVLKESLRFSHGAVHPMGRVVPDEGAQLSGVFIPGGTVVGMSNIFVHRNPEIFPEPEVFKPERWLGAEGDSLDTWLVAFSKGPRSCLGINLGWCELYMAFATIIRRYDLVLDGVSPSDWKWKDAYIPHYYGPELQVRAKKRLS